MNLPGLLDPVLASEHFHLDWTGSFPLLGLSSSAGLSHTMQSSCLLVEDAECPGAREYRRQAQGLDWRQQRAAVEGCEGPGLGF